MPTIRDVAKMAGVSVSTVSLAFSSPHRLRPETLEKVHEAARTAGYVGDPVARSLAGGSSRLRTRRASPILRAATRACGFVRS